MELRAILLVAATVLAVSGATAIVLNTIKRLSQELRGARASQLATLQAVALEAERRADETHELLEELRAANRIIREREQAFRLTFDRSPLGAAMVAPAGRFLRVNTALCKITGYSEGELLRRDVFMIVHRDDLPVTKAEGLSLLGGAERVALETRATRADGAMIWLKISAGLVRDDDGHPLHILAHVEDVTERKRYEEHLQVAQRRMELVLRTIPEHFWLKDTAGRYLLASHSLASFNGLSHEAFIGSTADDIYTPDVAAQVRASEALMISQGQAVFSELEAQNQDGESRLLMVTRAPVYDTDGSLVGIVGVGRDITEQRRAEERLREQDVLLRSLSDNLPDGLIYQMERTPDGRGRFRYLSAGVERLWGVSAEAVYANPELVWSRWHPEDRPAFERAARQALEQLSVFEFEGRVLLPDGSSRWSFSRSTPHPLADGRVLRNGVELDITARKRAESDLQRRIEALQTLNQIGQALTGWTRLSDGLASAAALLQRLFPASAIAVWEYTPTTRALRPLLLPEQAYPQPADRPLSLNADQLAPGLRERQQALVTELEPGHQLFGGSGQPQTLKPLPALLLSLRARNNVVGLLCIGATDCSQCFSPDDVALSQTVGSLLANAIENARLYADARSDAAEQERRRLARELHDSVSQALFAANRAAELLPQLWELDPDEGRAALYDLHRFTGAALAEMRALLVELRPRALIEAPLHESLAFLLPAMAARSSSAFGQQLAPAPPLPPDVQVALYRIAQEALGNASRHARAHRVTLTLAVTPPYVAGLDWAGTVTLSVADDGRGFLQGASPKGHFGLRTMGERALEIDAKLTVDSALGQGTLVTVRWHGAARPAEKEFGQ